MSGQTNGHPLTIFMLNSYRGQQVYSSLKKRENTETKNYKNLPAEWQDIRPAVPFF